MYKLGRIISDYEAVITSVIAIPHSALGRLCQRVPHSALGRLLLLLLPITVQTNICIKHWY